MSIKNSMNGCSDVLFSAKRLKITSIYNFDYKCLKDPNRRAPLRLKGIAKKQPSSLSDPACTENVILKRLLHIFGLNENSRWPPTTCFNHLNFDLFYLIGENDSLFW
jgi:hypothetical protein